VKPSPLSFYDSIIPQTLEVLIVPYTPYCTIVVTRNCLKEDEDLTKPLSYFMGKDAYLVVKNETFFHSLSINKILTTLPHFDKTLLIKDVFTDLFTDEFVAQFQNLGMPLKTFKGHYPKHLDVFNPVAVAGFDVHFTSTHTPTVIDDVKKKGYLDDLVIVSKRDMTHFLVAVNGIFHRTTYVGNTLYVLDGFRTIRISGRKDILVVDTKDVGGHTIVPLTPDNTKLDTYNGLTKITVDKSLLGKSTFAVIDGYFYHRDQEVLTVVDDNHITINTPMLPLIQQLRHSPKTLYRVDHFGSGAEQGSRRYSDPYEQTFLNKNSVASNTLKTRDFQYSRLTTFHSFLVVMNNPDLFTVATDVIPTGTPQFYHDLSKRSVSGMLNYGCGLSPTYLVSRDSYGRKSIFIPEQDYDLDYQDQSINPPIIPTLLKDPLKGSDISARFIDYVSA
jgi:hypothetical protein